MVLNLLIYHKCMKNVLIYLSIYLIYLLSYLFIYSQ